jgi:hypothetical protein
MLLSAIASTCSSNIGIRCMGKTVMAFPQVSRLQASSSPQRLIIAASATAKKPSSSSFFVTWRGLATQQQFRRRLQLSGPRRVRYNLAKKQLPGGRGIGGPSHSSSSSSGKYPTYIYWVGGIAVVGSVWTYVSYMDYAPLTHRRRWIATNPQFEKEMGDENYQQLIQQQFRGKVLPRLHPATQLIERVGSRIFQAAGQFADKNGLDYFDKKNVTFTVVDSEQANAFVLPGEWTALLYCTVLSMLVYLLSFNGLTLTHSFGLL